jgi:hypothetical protein
MSRRSKLERRLTARVADLETMMVPIDPHMDGTLSLLREAAEALGVFREASEKAIRLIALNTPMNHQLADKADGLDLARDTLRKALAGLTWPSEDNP